MKKFSTIFMVLSIIFLLASCAAENQEESSASFTTASVQTEMTSTTLVSSTSQSEETTVVTGPTDIIDELFGHLNKELYSADCNNFACDVMAWMPAKGEVMLSTLATYYLMNSTDDTIHHFLVFLPGNFYDNGDEYLDISEYVYEGSTVSEWKDERKATCNEFNDLVDSFEENGMTEDQIVSDERYISLKEEYDRLERIIEVAEAECIYSSYLKDGYYMILEFFESFGFEQFGNIEDPEWQITLSHTYGARFAFGVSGTAENLAALMKGNTEYRINLAYADENGWVQKLMGWILSIKTENSYRYLYPYWIKLD